MSEREREYEANMRTLRRRRRLGVVEQERSVLGGGGGGGVQREEVVLVRRRLVPCEISEELGRSIYALYSSSKVTLRSKGHGAAAMPVRARLYVPWMPIVVARQSQRPAIAAWTRNSLTLLGPVASAVGCRTAPEEAARGGAAGIRRPGGSGVLT